MFAEPPEVTAGLEQKAEFFQHHPVSRETLMALETYAGLLDEWQPRVNLVGPATLPLKWHRHFLDSAQLIPFLPGDAARLADLGSGAGFPGLVLAIMTSLDVTLVESRSRKCRFLETVIDQCGLKSRVRILNDRVETLKLPPFDVVTARAFAPLDRIFLWSRHLLSRDGVMILPKGTTAPVEIEAARKSFLFDASLHASVTDSASHIVTARRVRLRRPGSGVA